MPLIPALGEIEAGDLCEFQASLVYKDSLDFHTEKPCLETATPPYKKRKEENWRCS